MSRWLIGATAASAFALLSASGYAGVGNTWDESEHTGGDANGTTGQTLAGSSTLYHSIIGNVGGGPTPEALAVDESDLFKFHWHGDGALTGFFDCNYNSIEFDGCTFVGSSSGTAASAGDTLTLQLLESDGVTGIGSKVFDGSPFSFTSTDSSSLDAGDYYFLVSAGVDPPFIINFNNPVLGIDVLAVAEPASLAILGLGLAGLAGLRRRRA